MKTLAILPSVLWFSTTFSGWWLMVNAEPTSKPYIPFRTDPKDHPFVKHMIDWNDNRSNRQPAVVLSLLLWKNGIIILEIKCLHRPLVDDCDDC